MLTACSVPEVGEVSLHTTVGLVLETRNVEHQRLPTTQTNGNISASLCNLGENVKRDLIMEPKVTYG